MEINEFIKATRGCDKIIFKLTEIGEQEYNTKELAEVLEALEKQIPKELHKLQYSSLFCPNCGVNVLGNSGYYCSRCGQHYKP